MAELTVVQDQNLLGLAHRTVGFMIERPEGDVGHLVPAGSGVIVSARGVIFLITAGHVAQAVKDSRRAGVYGVGSFLQDLRPVEIDPAYCDFIIDWNGEHSYLGPDIAAIKLPYEKTAQIAQTRTVYNFDRRVELMDEISTDGDFILAGSPSTATMRHVSIDEFQRRDNMTFSLIAGKRSPSEHSPDGHDRFNFLPIYEESTPPPTFEGMSGGGLWYIHADEPGAVPILGGVAYFQSDRLEGGNRRLTCAGPQSVYAKIVHKAIEKWVD